MYFKNHEASLSNSPVYLIKKVRGKESPRRTIEVKALTGAKKAAKVFGYLTEKTQYCVVQGCDSKTPSIMNSHRKNNQHSLVRSLMKGTDDKTANKDI